MKKDTLLLLLEYLDAYEKLIANGSSHTEFKKIRPELKLLKVLIEKNKIN